MVLGVCEFGAHKKRAKVWAQRSQASLPACVMDPFASKMVEANILAAASLVLNHVDSRKFRSISEMFSHGSRSRFAIMRRLEFELELKLEFSNFRARIRTWMLDVGFWNTRQIN